MPPKKKVAPRGGAKNPAKKASASKNVKKVPPKPREIRHVTHRDYDKKAVDKKLTKEARRIRDVARFYVKYDRKYGALKPKITKEWCEKHFPDQTYDWCRGRAKLGAKNSPKTLKKKKILLGASKIQAKRPTCRRLQRQYSAKATLDATNRVRGTRSGKKICPKLSLRQIQRIVSEIGMNKVRNERREKKAARPENEAVTIRHGARIRGGDWRINKQTGVWSQGSQRQGGYKKVFNEKTGEIYDYDEYDE